MLVGGTLGSDNHGSVIVINDGFIAECDAGRQSVLGRGGSLGVAWEDISVHSPLISLCFLAAVLHASLLCHAPLLCCPALEPANYGLKPTNCEPK